MNTVEYPKEMRRIVPEGRRGIARIEHYRISRHEIDMASMGRAGGLAYTDPKKTYTKLLVDGELMMSDTQMERTTNLGFLWEATGDVLIAGLGIGLVLHPLVAKPEVRSVTVIEKYPDVIALVGRTVPRGVDIICADIFDWRPKKGTKFDTIYFDIWPDQCTDNLEEMGRLHQAFKYFKRSRESYMDSWFRETLRSMKRDEDRWMW